MASLAMNVIKWCVPTVMPTMRDTARFRASIVGRAYPTPASATRWVRSRCNIQQATILGHPVYTIAPKVGGSRWHILYAHGGGYVRPLRKVHWGIVRGLIQATRATVTLPIYPLSPEHDHEPAHALVKAVYRRIASAIPPENIVMSGDSSGGGLALAQVLLYRDERFCLPGRLVLFSPWLDITMSNPNAKDFERDDAILSIASLRLCGTWWANGKDKRSPLLSPIFGKLAGLPPIDVFQGSNDVFAPDARLFAEKVRAAGGQISYFEYPGAFHVFVGATLTPEARDVYRKIKESLR